MMLRLFKNSCIRDLHTLFLFMGVTLSFKNTDKFALVLVGLISILQFFRLHKKKISKEVFFETYFYLLIYSSIFAGSVHKVLLIILLIFFLYVRYVDKRGVIKTNSVKTEKLIIVLFGLITINHLIFLPYFKGLDIYIYFILIPLLFIGIKKLDFEIEILKSIKVYIFSTIIVTILLFVVNCCNNTLILKVNTFFPKKIGLSHVYFGIFLGITNGLILTLYAKKQRFFILYFDLILFVFNCALLIYIGARMSLIGVLFILLIYLYKNIKINNSLKIVCIVLLLCSLLFIGSKMPRIKQGLDEIKRLQTAVKTNNKEELILNSWRNMYMRYLVTSYTFKELKTNWFLGIGMQNVEKKIGTKIKKDDYKYFTGINTHNQYLHFFIGIGIFGFLYFLCLLVFLLKSKETSIYLLLFFILIMLTESVLVRGKGILLFTFFMLLFFSKKLSNDKNSSHS